MARKNSINEGFGETDYYKVRYTYTWTINNFETLAATDFIKSPIYEADYFKYKFFLYDISNGVGAGDEVKLSIELNEGGHCLCYHKASIINKNGIRQNTKSTTLQILPIRTQSGVVIDRTVALSIINRRELYNRRDELLPDNKLTIFIEIFHLFQKSCKIDNIKESSLKINDKIAQDFVKLFINKKHSDIIISCNGKDIKAHKSILCAKSEIFEKMISNNINQDKIVINDVPSDVMEEVLKFIYFGKTDKLENMAENLLKAANKFDLINLKIQCEAFFGKDFGQLFKNKKHSDIIVSCNGKDIKAHKAIIATRSDVFDAMFEHQLEESKQNKVIIEDIEADVLDEFLKFIYTGQTEKLNIMPDKLFIVADKYNVGDLKAKCESMLRKNVSINNVINTLIIAELHSATNLKTTAINYIIANLKQVMNSSDWKNIRNYPNLLEEILKLK